MRDCIKTVVDYYLTGNSIRRYIRFRNGWVDIDNRFTPSKAVCRRLDSIEAHLKRRRIEELEQELEYELQRDQETDNRYDD